MPIVRLSRRLAFPPADSADEDGIVAVGGDLSPERLLLAYRSGIFPWYHDDLPILWHSPDPRMVLEIARLHVPRSLEKTIRRRPYEIRLDTAFREVISACAEVPRPDQEGTWITKEMLEAYCELHRLGLAHSCEAWSGDRLTGGLYGVALGRIFFGESMFALAPDASKIALVTLVRQIERWGFSLVDCQVHTEHLERFGAALWSRRKYLKALEKALEAKTRAGRWEIEPNAGEPR